MSLKVLSTGTRNGRSSNKRFRFPYPGEMERKRDALVKHVSSLSGDVDVSISVSLSCNDFLWQDVTIYNMIP